MNGAQKARYGFIQTFTTPLHRFVTCGICGARFTVMRRGPGANALGAASKLRGMLIRHLNERHPEK